MGVARARFAAIVVALAVVALLAFGLHPGDVDPAIDGQAADDRGSPSLLEGAGPGLEGSARADGTKQTPADADGAWVVRGQVFLGWNTPAPEQRVTARAFAGYVASGTPILEAVLISDQDGRIAWALSPPRRPMRLVFSVQKGRTEKDCLALPDAPPPTSVTLYIRTHDARVVGRVTDMEGRPVEGAEVIYHYRAPPIPCAEDGTYGVAVSSAGKDVRLTACAPGYASICGSARLSGPRSEARLDLKLRREFRVTGRVTDPDGRPLEGAVVESFMTSFTNQAVTDARGEYSLGHLDPGRPRHSVFARYAEFTEARADVVTRGESVTQDFRLGRGVRIEGQVTNAEGVALEGASLYIGFCPTASNRIDTLAKDDGRFIFRVVEPGAQTLVASRAGYAPTRRVLDVPSDEDVVSGLTVVLEKGREVSGCVMTPDGRPVDRAYVSWRHQGEYTETRVVTDPTGRFRSRHLPFTRLEAEVYGGAFQRLTQAVPDGTEPVTGFVLTVQPSAKIAGRVVDARTGEPIPTFVVRLVRPESRPGDKPVRGYSATWSREGRCFSGTDGYWDTAGEQLTAEGIVGVEVAADGYATATERRVVATVDPARDQVVLRLLPGATLTGTVVDATTRRPIEGTVVKLFDEGHPLRSYGDDVHGRKMARTNAKGLFRIEELAEGVVYLSLVEPDHAPLQHGPIPIQSGTEVRAGQIAMGTGGSIVGIAADADGQLLAGARIEAIFTHPGPHAATRTWDTLSDAEGCFRFDRIPAGSVTVRRMRPRTPGTGFRPVRLAYSVRIEVTDGQEATARLAPSGSATLRGRIFFDGELPEGLQVTLEPRGEPLGPYRTARVVSGVFTFVRVEPGTYGVRCEHYEAQPGGPWRAWRGSTTVELAENEAKDIEVNVTIR